MTIPEKALVMTPRDTYDKAIIGIKDNRVVYSCEKVIEAGVELYGDIDSSQEWHEFNTFDEYLGKNGPVFEWTGVEA